MPSKKFTFEPGGRERLTVSWEGVYKNLSLEVDGAQVGAFDTAADLETPRSITLPDGSELRVGLEKYGPFQELRISRDNEPLPGSSGDPAAQLDGATGMLFLIAGLNAALGLISWMFDVQWLKEAGVSGGAIVAALIYAGLALWTRRLSKVALGIAVALFIADGIFVLVNAAQASRTPPVGGLVARFFFLLPMIRGFSAIDALLKPKPKKRPRPAIAPRPGTVTAAPAPASPAAPPQTSVTAIKTLAGDAEKKRLQLSESNARPSSVSFSGRTVTSAGPASVDAARRSLRFIAHKCEITEEGLRVTNPDGTVRVVAFGAIGAIVARQLPPDPPWDGALIVDVAPAASLGSGPVRIFGTTVVNYAAIPGGASGSRLDNTRRLTAFLAGKAPHASIDAATAEFLRGPKVPERFLNMTQFIEYDSRYG